MTAELKEVNSFTGTKQSVHLLSRKFHQSSNTYENRLVLWKELKKLLPHCEDGILKNTILFWDKISVGPLTVDPYDQSTWPTPWELIDENIYCEFSQLLAISYTVMLTEGHSNCCPILHVGFDKTQSRMYYILFILGQFLVVNEEKTVEIVSALPADLQFQKTHIIKNQY